MSQAENTNENARNILDKILFLVLKKTKRDKDNIKKTGIK
jgi:hypothetical protein